MTDTTPARRHTRDDVARTAMRLLDEVGLPDLTMRRLATALDVAPSALYHHYPNKQTLLAALADRIVGEDTAGPGEDAAGWPADVRAAAARLRERLLAHRDGAELVASTLSLGLGAGAALTALERAVAGAGLDAQTTHRAAAVLLHFVLGQVGTEQQRRQYARLGVLDPSTDRADTSGEAFAFGVDLLTAGLGARAGAVPAASRTLP